MTISPLLRALRTDGQEDTAATGGAIASAPGANPAPPTKAAWAHDPARRHIPSAHRFRLRRDGARPLVFDGALLIGLEARTPVPPGAEPPAGAAIQRVDLYATVDGTIVAALRLEYTGEAATRPVYRAGQLAGAADLQLFLDAYDPGATPGASAALAQALRADFDRIMGASPLTATAAAGADGA